MIHFSIPDPVGLILHRLKKNGYKSYIVGGAVRDKMLHNVPEDLDILTSAPLDRIQALFLDQKVTIAGKTFPVCLVNGIEVASPRCDHSMLSDNLIASDEWLASDLGHRDLTINAMAWDPETQNLHDPYDGQKDLKNKIIRFTQDPDQRIKEDPVRMIRACRFTALLNGHLDPASQKAMKTPAEGFEQDVAPERVQQEIIKAMGLTSPSVFFLKLRELGLLEKVFPSLDRCYTLDGGPFHGETVFEHCMLVGDALPARQPLLRLAGFLHDTGKFDAATFKDNRLTFAGHEKCFKEAQNDLEHLRFSNKDVAYILSLLQAHMRPLNDQSTPKAVRRLLAMLDGFKLEYTDFMRMRIADKKSNLKKRGYTLEELKIRLGKLFAQMHSNASLNISQLRISGRDIIRLLEISPGPEVGRIKKILLERVLDDPGLNTPQQLKDICLSLKTNK